MHYRGKHRHYRGNRHYSAFYHCWLFPCVPSDFAGTVVGNQHCSTGTIERSLLYTDNLRVLYVWQQGKWNRQQKWIGVLLVGLFFFNNPFFAAQVSTAFLKTAFHTCTFCVLFSQPVYIMRCRSGIYCPRETAVRRFFFSFQSIMFALSLQFSLLS